MAVKNEPPFQEDLFDNKVLKLPPKNNAEFLVLVCDLMQIHPSIIRDRCREWENAGIIPRIPVSYSFHGRMDKLRKRMLEE